MDEGAIWCKYLYHFPSGTVGVLWGSLEAEVRRHTFSCSVAEVAQCERALFPRIGSGQEVSISAPPLRRCLPAYIDYLHCTFTQTPALYGYIDKASYGRSDVPQWASFCRGFSLPGDVEHVYDLVTGLEQATLVRLSARTHAVLSTIDLRNTPRDDMPTARFEIHSTRVSIRRYLNALEQLLSQLRSSAVSEIRLTWRSASKEPSSGTGEVLPVWNPKT